MPRIVPLNDFRFARRSCIFQHCRFIEISFIPSKLKQQRSRRGIRHIVDGIHHTNGFEVFIDLLLESILTKIHKLRVITLQGYGSFGRDAAH